MRRLVFAVFVAAIALATVPHASAHPITEACTVGFFKNNPQLINGGSCTFLAGLSSDTKVSALFPGVESCVGDLTILQLLQADTAVCGPGSTLAGAEVILLRQAITRVLNGVYSFDACSSVAAVITTTNNRIALAVATDDLSKIKSLANRYDTLNDDSPCTIAK
jgi:hypothetical protein